MQREYIIKQEDDTILSLYDIKDDLLKKRHSNFSINFKHVDSEFVIKQGIPLHDFISEVHDMEFSFTDHRINENGIIYFFKDKLKCGQSL